MSQIETSPSTRYAPEFFNRGTVEEMRGVILSPYGGLSVDERWEIETEWLRQRIEFSEGAVVVDYGCGIGRMAKAIEHPIIGVDISISMLLQASAYVDRQDFVPVAPLGLKLLYDHGFVANGAMAIWSLQHVPMLGEAVELVMDGLSVGSTFWLVDLCERAIPVMTDDGSFGMIKDQKNVLAALQPWCALEDFERLDFWKEQPVNPGALYKFKRK